MNSRCAKCGKVCHPTRKDARRARKTTKGGAHMSAYKCGAWWHLGTTPPETVRGVLARSKIQAAPATPQQVTDRRKGKRRRW